MVGGEKGQGGVIFLNEWLHEWLEEMAQLTDVRTISAGPQVCVRTCI